MGNTEKVLLPCKHCQGEGELKKDNETQAFYVQCKTCKAVSPFQSTESNAEKAWNEMCRGEDELPSHEITTEMIAMGIEKGYIQFVRDPNMNSGTVCQIGAHWFYFGGLTAEESEPSDFLMNTYMPENVQDIYNTLHAMRNEEETKDEYIYYHRYLCEKLFFSSGERFRWKKPSLDPVPAGEPLVLKIRCEGEDHDVIVGPVYYLRDCKTRDFIFVEAPSLTEPSQVLGFDTKILFWDYWPFL